MENIMESTFANTSLPIDRRLLKSIMKCGFVKPTDVQARTIPLALDGKDLLVRARTGSGKTLAYALPILNKILDEKSDSDSTMIRAIVLVPTRELVSQVYKQFKELMYYCREAVTIAALGNEKQAIQETWLKSLPDIVIATPGKLAAYLKTLAKDLKLRESVSMFVVDEADLVFSYGYAEDVSSIIGQLPKTCQSFLMSATLNDDVHALKKLILHNPATVKIEESKTDGKLSQFYVKVDKTVEKDLFLYALFRLKLISGKTLLFVNSVPSCYRLKLLLEQYHIRAAVLNSELPVNSRLHIMDQFNRGNFDYLIATDEAIQFNQEENVVDDDEDEDESGDDDKEQEADESLDDEEEEEEEDDNSSDSENISANEESDGESNPSKDAPSSDASEDEKNAEPSKQPSSSKKATTTTTPSRKRQRDEDGEEFGVARGIDFQDVATVLNVDFPLSYESYTHRIGRTARGGASGTALSIVCGEDPDELEMLEEIQGKQPLDQNNQQPVLLALDMKEIEGFRYRVEDVRRAVTRKAVHDARVAEIHQEAINSKRLAAHFDDNPNDLSLLRHDSVLCPKKVVAHMSHIPEYLLPKNLQEASSGLTATAPARFNGSTSGRRKWKERHKVGEFRSKKSFQARKGKMKLGQKRSYAKKNPLF